MNYTVVKFGKLGVIPAVGGADKVAGDALQAVDRLAVTAGAFMKFGRSVLIAAIHAAVAVVVHGAIAYVVLIHEVDYCCDGVGVVGRVAVNLNIEDVTATGKRMVGRLDFCLVAGAAVVVNRHVVGVGVVYFIGNARQYAECLAVFARELAGEAFGRSCEH